LIDCFSESDDENQPMWDLLILTLQELEQLDARHNSRMLRHWFEMSLLTLTGFQPQLFQCLNCDEELAPVSNYISLNEGGVLCPNCAQGRRDLELIEADVLKVLRFFQSRPWGAVRQVNIRPHILSQVDNLLYRYLLTILERQLKSVDFMRRLQHMAQIASPTATERAGIPSQNDAAGENEALSNQAISNEANVQDTPHHAHS
jgi:DNA repair protein RecO (recombination protein O)